jgi:hypothetical protein
MFVDLYERLKMAAEELLDNSVDLTSHLDSQYTGRAPNREMKKYIESMRVYTEGFREVLSEAQSIPDSAATVRNFASKLDGYLSMIRLPADKLIDASENDPTTTSIANAFSDKSQIASEAIEELYRMTDVKIIDRNENVSNAFIESNQTTEDIFFWLTASKACNETLHLSSKLVNGPLDKSADQEQLASFTVKSLLQDWDDGITFIKELADEARNEGNQGKVSVAVSVLIFTHNQLRTLYNNLARTCSTT